jgi:hypothetical protein
MRQAGWVVLLSVVLAAGVQAAGQDTAAALSKELSALPAPPTHAKNKAVRSNKSKPVTGKVVPKARAKVKAKVKAKPDAVTESLDGSADQSVQLKGVRG